MPSAFAASAMAAGEWAWLSPEIGTQKISRASPAKGCSRPLMSFDASMPLMRTSGRGLRASNSAMAAASATPPAGLCPPSSHSSAPAGSEVDQRAAGERAAGAPAIRPAHARLDRRGRRCREQAVRSGGDGDAGILVLVAALQARQRQVEEAARVLVDEPPAFLADVEIAARDDERRAHARGLALDDGQRLVGLRRR